MVIAELVIAKVVVGTLVVIHVIFVMVVVDFLFVGIRNQMVSFHQKAPNLEFCQQFCYKLFSTNWCTENTFVIKKSIYLCASLDDRPAIRL